MLALGLAVLVLAAVCGWVGLLGVQTLRARRRDAQILRLLDIFGPVVERARSDPRVLLAWYPLANAARQTFPDAFAAIDQAGVEPFPFGPTARETAHARWTTDWLEWEHRNDGDSRRNREAIEAELERSDGAAAQAARARLDALERDKLEQYQRKYEEYVKVSRALGALTDTPTAGPPNAGI
jgi:hypothetical protein